MHVSKLNVYIQNGALLALFAFMFMLFNPAGSASAQEVDSLRIGGDYKFLTLREGASFKECRQACNNDVSCKAWTFIKERVRRKEGLQFNLGPDLNIGFGGKKEIIPPQCRLKHTVGPKHDNECCTSGVKRVAERRRPNKAEQCAEYAEKALEQADENLSKRCRFRGDRWHSNYRDHYSWCMKSPKRSSVNETQARNDKLRECRGGRQIRNRRCDRFASTAMDILKQARENNCRNTDSGWSKDHEQVYGWCLDHRPEERTKVMERAQTKLSSCIRRGGGERVERCETYADNALAQIKKSGQNQCGNRGDLWRNDFKTQYQFCRRNKRQTLRRANQRRVASLDRCLRRSDEARVMETGHVEVRQRNIRQWHKVRFTKRFRKPVVIMGPVSSNGDDPAHARVRSVTPRGFEFRIEEFGKDGAHVLESLSYMVVEKGIHTFNGSLIEAGTIVTGADMVNRDWSGVQLSHRWNKAPVVLTQTQTFAGSDLVNTRVRGVSRRSFEVSLSEEERDRKGHARETVGFVAMTMGRHQVDGGRDRDVAMWSGRVSRASHKWREVNFPRRFGGAPALFARAQSSNGADAFDIRYRRLGARGVQMRLQEEQSKDRETNHTNEVLGVVAMPFGSYWAVSSRSVEDQVSRAPVRPAEPGIDLASCSDYSKSAVRQFRAAERFSCRTGGDNWHGDANRHRRWCRRNGLAAASDTLQQHRTALRRCGPRADDDNGPAADRRAVKLNWKRIDGQLKQISVGSDGTVWGVNSSNRVFKRGRGGWKQLRGRIKQLDVGSRKHIWGVGTDDRVYRWNGRSWKEKSGRLMQVSVGADATVWGVNSSHNVYRWNGRSWAKVRGGLKQISVGNKDNIWGVNRSNNIYRWDGRRWIEMPGTFKQVSVASNGGVFAISSEDQVYRWNGRRNKWVKHSGSLKQISAGSGKQLWGVSDRNRVYRVNMR